MRCGGVGQVDAELVGVDRVVAQDVVEDLRLPGERFGRLGQRGIGLLGLPERDAGELVGLDRHRLDDVVRGVRVQRDAVVEVDAAAVADRHRVEAVVAHGGAEADAVDRVAVEVDGDRVGADHEAVELAVVEVVEHARAVRQHLAAGHVLGDRRSRDRPGVGRRRRVGVARGVAGADPQLVSTDGERGELERRRTGGEDRAVERAFQPGFRLVGREREGGAGVDRRAVGPESIRVSGGVTSGGGPLIVHVCVDGVGSALPVRSSARTANVCVPVGRPVSSRGDAQGAYGAPSSAHSKRRFGPGV